MRGIFIPSSQVDTALSLTPAILPRSACDSSCSNRIFLIFSAMLN
nr:MAG TPA: hypothetical protein [Caudoviricetes sp.]